MIWSHSDSGEGYKCNDKLPRVNWLQHASAHDNFSSQEKFLTSNFLFSLEAQKPHTEGAMSARYDHIHKEFHCVELVYFPFIFFSNYQNINLFLLYIVEEWIMEIVN